MGTNFNVRVAQLAEAADSKSAKCRFEACRGYHFAYVAQLEERHRAEVKDVGSIPAVSTISPGL